MDKLVDTHMFGESLWPRAAVPWAPSPSTSPSPTIFRPERTRETIGEMVFAEPADHLLLGARALEGLGHGGSPRQAADRPRAQVGDGRVAV